MRFRRPKDPSVHVLRADVPLEWARRHKHVVVAFEHLSRDDWYAYLVGENGSVLLRFPWPDLADYVRAGRESEQYPIKVSDEEWVGLDQGWFAWVKSVGDDVYVAEGNSEEWGGLRRARKLALVRPGVVSFDGPEIRWNVTNRAAYERAWQEAISSCRQGHPSPLGTLSESRDQMRLHL